MEKISQEKAFELMDSKKVGYWGFMGGIMDPSLPTVVIGKNDYFLLPVGMSIPQHLIDEIKQESADEGVF